MNRAIVFLAGAAALLGGCGAQNQTAGPSQQSANIPFVRFGNIFDWRADGQKGIYIESESRHWYYATFMFPCMNLPFAQRVGFRTTPPLPLDKFDSIVVDGEPCQFQSFTEVPGPPGAPPKPS
jgi:hypothetical protein